MNIELNPSVQLRQIRKKIKSKKKLTRSYQTLYVRTYVRLN